MKYDIRISSEKRTLVDISGFDLQSGKITLLLGESGIGKTLISRAIFGLLPVQELDITINTQSYNNYLSSPECSMIQRNGFFVFQEPSSHLNPMRTLSQQLNEGDISDISSNRKIIGQLFPAFSEVEREQLLSVFPKPYRPSGGEKQRILIAMAFKKIAQMQDNNSGLFIFDEPTGNLDNEYRNLFLKILLTAQYEKQFTVLLITHDYSMISEITSQYKELQKKIVFQELQRKKDALTQISFSPESYLNWLESVKPEKRPEPLKQPILSLHYNIEVFERSLTITSDPKHTTPSPLEIYPGDAVYLKAASGAGKTTVAKIMMGLQGAAHFQLKIGDLSLSPKSSSNLWKRKIWAKNMSMVFQHADEALNLNGKVKDIFRGLPLSHRSNQDFLTANLIKIFDDNLDNSFLDRPVAYLSGGQKQRLNLIRALILDTDILILDEPFNGLDFITMRKVLDMLQKRQKEGKSFLIISHNEEIIDRVVPANRIYYLNWERR